MENLDKDARTQLLKASGVKDPRSEVTWQMAQEEFQQTKSEGVRMGLYLRRKGRRIPETDAEWREVEEGTGIGPTFQEARDIAIRERNQPPARKR